MNNNDYEKRLAAEEEETELVAKGIARIIAVFTFGALMIALISVVF